MFATRATTIVRQLKIAKALCKADSIFITVSQTWRNHSKKMPISSSTFWNNSMVLLADSRLVGG
jgi:hypothetical protein